MRGIYSETRMTETNSFLLCVDLSSKQVHSGWYFRNGDKEWYHGPGVTASKDWTANYVRDPNASQKSN